jgi:fructose-bisphosphate aldolase / 2-amino-3,7-dideoxy-D-threo-hept-6-ulosonate synthase
MSTGKQLRMRRILDPATHSSVMFAFSHGTSAPEVLKGIEHPAARYRAVRDGGADCVFLAPGLIESLAPVIAEGPGPAIVAKVTATATRGAVKHQERVIASVEHAVGLGADGVVAMVAFAPENEPDVISFAGEMGETCSRLGVPFIAEAEFPNAYYGDEDYAERWGLQYLRRSARLCAELGADVVKSNWPGSATEFAQIVDCVSVPVIVAGGSRASDLELLSRIAEARSVGAVGCSVGRNIFQHDDPEAITRAISAVTRGTHSPQEALDTFLGQLSAASA